MIHKNIVLYKFYVEMQFLIKLDFIVHSRFRHEQYELSSSSSRVQASFLQLLLLLGCHLRRLVGI